MAGVSPLYPLLNEISRAAANGMPFLAVTMAVALPDICVSLESSDGRTESARYKAWCAANLPASNFSYLTPEDLYSMRCGVLHNGRFGDLKHNVSRVIFALPGNGSFTDCMLNDAYFYSVTDFCRHLTQAVHNWFERNRENPTVEANLPRLMQYRPEGLHPYVSGMTVLA